MPIFFVFSIFVLEKLKEKMDKVDKHPNLTKEKQGIKLFDILDLLFHYNMFGHT